MRYQYSESVLFWPDLAIPTSKYCDRLRCNHLHYLDCEHNVARSFNLSRAIRRGLEVRADDRLLCTNQKLAQIVSLRQQLGLACSATWTAFIRRSWQRRTSVSGSSECWGQAVTNCQYQFCTEEFWKVSGSSSHWSDGQIRPKDANNATKFVKRSQKSLTRIRNKNN